MAQVYNNAFRKSYYDIVVIDAYKAMGMQNVEQLSQNEKEKRKFDKDNKANIEQFSMNAVKNIHNNNNHEFDLAQQIINQHIIDSATDILNAKHMEQAQINDYMNRSRSISVTPFHSFSRGAIDRSRSRWNTGRQPQQPQQQTGGQTETQMNLSELTDESDLI